MRLLKEVRGVKNKKNDKDSALPFFFCGNVVGFLKFLGLISFFCVIGEFGQLVFDEGAEGVKYEA